MNYSTVQISSFCLVNIRVAMGLKIFASIFLPVEVGFLNSLLPTVFVRLTSLLFAKLFECIKLYANIKLFAYLYPVMQEPFRYIRFS